MTGPVDLVRLDRLLQVYDPWWVLNLEPCEITPDPPRTVAGWTCWRS